MHPELDLVCSVQYTDVTQIPHVFSRLEGTTGILRTWQTEMADLIAAQAFSQFGSFPGSSKFYSASLFQKASEQ